MVSSIFRGVVLSILISGHLMACQTLRSPQESNREPANPFRGSLECTNCHVEASPKYSLEKITDFVTLSEYRTWITADPHSKSYISIVPDEQHFRETTENLERLQNEIRCVCKKPEFGPSNKLSARILQSLAGEDYEDITKIFRRMSVDHDLLISPGKVNEFSPRAVGLVKQCFACHVGWDLRHPNFDVDAIKYGTGVSCENCHGPSDRWIDAHEKPDWRKIDPRKKEADFELVNLRHPITKARQCYSCHIGDLAQGRFVTHEMYAAGHPPLPSIEIESYTDQLPRHWRYLPEKSDFLHAADFARQHAANLGMKDEADLKTDYVRSKSMLVGGLLALDQSYRLLTDLAAAQNAIELDSPPADAPVGTANSLSELFLGSPLQWPDYAAFDCGACHHSLRFNGPARVARGTPGRPREIDWPEPFAHRIMQSWQKRLPVDLCSQFDQALLEWAQAIDEQPFGNPNRLILTGQRISEVMLAAANEILAQPISREDCRRTLLDLCRSPIDGDDTNKRTPEYHSARQFAWALQLGISEIELQPGSSPATGSHLFTPIDPPMAAAITSLRDSFSLSLPGAAGITTRQPELLSAWYRFDPRVFYSQLQALQEQIEANVELPQLD